MIDAKRLREEIDIAAVIGRYVELIKAGPEFEALCPFHEERTPSFTVVPAKHFYHCFGCGAHGDVINFVREIDGVDFKEACERLGGKDYTPTTPRPAQTPAAEPDWTPITPVPRLAPSLFDDQRTCRLYNPKRAGTPMEWTTLRPAAVYEYADAAGLLVGYVLRCEFDGGKKITPQVTYAVNKAGVRRWCILPFPEPRPLYGLQELRHRPDAPVLVVEGEKCRDAATRLLPAYVTISAPGGSHGVGHADWRPLFGRDVLLWPDADQPGRECMLGWAPNGHQEPRKGVADILRGQVKRLRILDPIGQPEGWDVADAEKAGWTAAKVISWAKERVRPVPDRSALDDRESVTVQAEPPLVNAPAKIEPISPPVEAPEPPQTAQPAEIAPPPDVPPAEPVSAAPPQTRRTRRGMGVVDGGLSGATARALDPQDKPIPTDQIGLWHRLDLAMSSRGSPYQNLDNAVRVLLRHPYTAGRIWFDEFHQRYFTTFGDKSSERRQYADADDLHLAVWFQREIGLIKITESLARSAALTVGHMQPRDEPRDWMNELVWDGEPRIEGSLCRYFGAMESAYSLAAAKNFWISMVARVLNPGCQVDNMVVLESEQGKYKSSALGVIGGRWYAEAHESVTNKDFFMALQGVMLMEIAELDSFSRAETTKVKQVITCRSDRFRVPFGRVSQNHPRRNVFVGSTNQNSYLMDSTGARRFWPVKCGTISIDALRHDREQLFAEAVQMFRNGVSWWVVPDVEAKAEQEHRRAADTWEDRISDWLGGRDFTTVGEIAEFALDIPMSQVDRRVQLRIADALRVLGYDKFVSKTATKGGWQSQRGWRKKLPDRLPGVD